ncbi:MAG: DUF1987 domain-containing protein [Bacteroidota bacterium]
MRPLHIKGTDDSPEVFLDKAQQSFEISGKSLPEDVSAFFEPVLAWFREYVKDPLPATRMSIKMTYFNTASSKLLLDIFMILEELREKGNQVEIDWYYPSYDEEMKEAGIEYSEMLDLKFHIIETKAE